MASNLHQRVNVIWIKMTVLRSWLLWQSLDFSKQGTLREKRPYSEFLLFIFSPNVGKYRPEKLRIQTPFTQW